MDWNDLRHFVALARTGSVRAAGVQLGVSHTTVARRVEALEAQLGTRLFDRHRDGYVLTAAGRRMLPAAERVEDEVAALGRGLVGQDARLEGPLRLTCGDEYLAALLLDDLAPWCAENPGVELTLVRDERFFNLAKGEADLAVRVLGAQSSPPDYLVGHRAAPLQIAGYVARAHADRLDPAGPAARWLGYTDPRAIHDLLSRGAFAPLPVWGAFSTLSLAVRAALCGLGCALLPTYVGDLEPALQRMPCSPPHPVADIWLLYHPDLKSNARLQGARAVLRAGFARRSALFGLPAEPGPRWPDSAP
jgi:DNA-binding transcriptional LysR family regulator